MSLICSYYTPYADHERVSWVVMHNLKVCCSQALFTFFIRLVFFNNLGGKHRVGGLPRMSSSSTTHSTSRFKRYADKYDPIAVGSIDGQDATPHDKALTRAIDSTYRPNARVQGNARNTIFVGRLFRETNEAKLRSKFQRFGEIVNCRVVRDLVTGASRNYAFVEFRERGAAIDAYDAMNGVSVDGARLLVDFEWQRRMSGWKPRRLGGGFGGKKESGQLRFGCRDRPFQRPRNLPLDYREMFRQQKTQKR
ncbi:U11/U12 small nuclear ribonucleoprotein 35 kDa protein-like [Phlebotomus argentipes]|uniref:U11/U12 small nuclear ribonucleoprotein 35 kDa protein-like n=1 Tax=Phlebotomus argentipes TaxID=94469 RepID=UPI0028930D29|nr:U11/U12 small nuclear ribonucleoprotein 35 kDa protein-like [Phlebotomus argentipes]